MAKIKISSTDLIWIFRQKLEAFDDCPPEVAIAIVPAPDVGWMALWMRKAEPRTLFAQGALKLFRSSFGRFTF
jgi:hypothetical protein